MNNQITLVLPYPKKLFGIQYFKSLKIGFIFNNWTKLQFQENNGFKTSDDIKKYQELHGVGAVPNELIYAGAQVFCLINKTDPNFTKDGLLLALSATTDQNRELLMKSLINSESFGLKKDEKKKTIPDKMK